MPHTSSRPPKFQVGDRVRLKKSWRSIMHKQVRKGSFAVSEVHRSPDSGMYYYSSTEVDAYFVVEAALKPEVKPEVYKVWEIPTTGYPRLVATFYIPEEALRYILGLKESNSDPNVAGYQISPTTPKIEE